MRRRNHVGERLSLISYEEGTLSRPLTANLPAPCGHQTCAKGYAGALGAYEHKIGSRGALHRSATDSNDATLGPRRSEPASKQAEDFHAVLLVEALEGR